MVLLLLHAALPAVVQSSPSQSQDPLTDAETEEQMGLPVWLLYVAAQRAAEQQALNAEIVSPMSYVAGAPLTFDASNSVSKGGDLTYLWSLAKPDGSYTVLNSFHRGRPDAQCRRWRIPH